MSDVQTQAVVFQTTFEGLWRAYRGRLSPALLAELRGIGLDFEKLQAAYPLVLWESVSRRMASALTPDAAEHDAWRLLGRGFIDGYAQTLLGGAVLSMGRVVGTRRFLERMGRNFKTGSNFAPVTVTNTGDHEVQVESRFDPLFLPAWRGKPTVMPHFRLGVFEGILSKVVSESEVVLERADLEQQLAVYRIRWR